MPGAANRKPRSARRPRSRRAPRPRARRPRSGRGARQLAICGHSARVTHGRPDEADEDEAGVDPLGPVDRDLVRTDVVLRRHDGSGGLRERPRSSPIATASRSWRCLPFRRIDAMLPFPHWLVESGLMPNRRAAPSSTPPPRLAGGSAKGPTREALLAALAERERELAEAQARQTATAEILRVISQSPTDAQPVFESDRRHCRPSAPVRHGVRAASRRRRLRPYRRGDAGGSNGGPRARAYSDRCERQLSLARLPRQGDGPSAGLVADRAARTRTPHPRDVRRQLGAVPAADCAATNASGCSRSAEGGPIFLARAKSSRPSPSVIRR